MHVASNCGYENKNDKYEDKLVVSDTQSDSIQYLNFSKKWFIQFRFNIALHKIQFKILFNSKIILLIQFKR